MSEKLHDNSSAERQKKNAEQLEEAGAEKRAELERQLERNAEKSTGEDLESARHEALELAQTKEDEQPPEAEKPESRTVSPTKDVREASFKQTMHHIQKDMSPASRAFSKIIHNPTIDKASEALGKTLARPNLVLAGAIGTILIGSTVYFIAKKYGYVLSGFEAIGTFILGWAIGAVIEFARVGIKNRQR